jgi:hypothetical protein
MNINKTRDIQIVSLLIPIFVYIVCICTNDNHNRHTPNNAGVSDF